MPEVMSVAVQSHTRSGLSILLHFCQESAIPAQLDQATSHHLSSAHGTSGRGMIGSPVQWTTFDFSQFCRAHFIARQAAKETWEENWRKLHQASQANMMSKKPGQS